ncbi:MAG: TonB-dependent receptor [Prevotella sp.]|nr:TonB-dependent receptor [Prevotella sp.]
MIRKSIIVLAMALAIPFQVSAIEEVKEGIVADEHVNDSSRVYDLDEVIVVSQPKESALLRRQPVSSTMFDASDMQRLNVRDIREMAAYVPSFAMPQYGSRLTSSMYIRGIGSRVNSPAVGIYVDGMPLMSKSAFNFHTYELDRVDVLRGPQGTLYGLNTEGGLVRMYSKSPMRYQGTDVKLGFGSHFYRNIEAAHYQKLSDRFAFSLAGFYNGQNGFFRNQYSGERADLMNEAGGKLRLMGLLSQRASFDYIADYQYVRQNGFPYGVLDEATGKTASPSTNRQSNYRRNMLNTALNFKVEANGFDFFSTTSYQYLKDYMLMDQDYLPEDFMHLEQRQFQNALSQEFVVKSRNNSRWHWTVGAFGSYTWLKTIAPVYFGEGITAPIGNAIQTAMYNAMVQSMAGRMVQQGMPQAMAELAAKAAIEKAGGVTMDVTMDVPGLFRTPQFNLGFFHESNIDITDRLTATLGLRYDFTRSEVEYDTQATMAMTANVMGTEATYALTSALSHQEHNDFGQLLPKVGLLYRIDDNGSNVYATVSKGYRAGGFNIQMFSDILQTELNANSQNAMRGDYDVPHTDEDYAIIRETIAYKPEVSWNYEAGTHLNLFDRSMQFDFSAFYMQVRDQQLSVMAGDYGFGRMMVNAGKSFSCGIETSLRGQAFDNRLSWSAGYGFTHAVFKEYDDQETVGGVTQTVSYKDNYVPYVPMHTFHAAADYRHPFQGSFIKAIIIGANLSGQGKTYWDEANAMSQDIYAVLGAHADADFGWLNVSLWGRNLTDTNYNTFAVPSAASGTKYYFAQRGNPVQVGVDLRVSF